MNKPIYSFVLVFSLIAQLFFYPVPAAANFLPSLIKKSQLEKKSISFENFLENVKDELLPEDYEQIKKAFLPYKNNKMPKVVVTPLKGQDKAYQIQVKSGSQVTLVEVREQGEGALVRVVGSKGKQNIQYRLDPLQLKENEIQKVIGELDSNKNKTEPIFTLLTPEQVQKLSKAQAKIYFQHLRNIMDSAEKLSQKRFKNMKKTSQVTPGFWGLDKAWASANPVPCVLGGWMGTLDPEKGCVFSQDILDANRCSINGAGNGYRCNPIIYGDQKNACLSTTDTYGECKKLAESNPNQADKSFSSAFLAYKKASDSKSRSFEHTKKGIETTINGLIQSCPPVKNSNNSAANDMSLLEETFCDGNSNYATPLISGFGQGLFQKGVTLLVGEKSLARGPETDPDNSAETSAGTSTVIPALSPITNVSSAVVSTSDAIECADLRERLRELKNFQCTQLNEEVKKEFDCEVPVVAAPSAAAASKGFNFWPLLAAFGLGMAIGYALKKRKTKVVTEQVEVPVPVPVPVITPKPYPVIVPKPYPVPGPPVIVPLPVPVPVPGPVPTPQPPMPAPTPTVPPYTPPVRGVQ